MSGSTLNRQVTSFQSFRIYIFFLIFLFLFEVKCSLTVMSWQDYGSIVASSAEINRIAQPTVAGYPTTKNRHSSVCKPWLYQTPAAHASKAARFYISPCPPHPPSFFLFFFGLLDEWGPRRGPTMRISDFFSGGGEQSRETQAARIKCTTKESDEPQLKLIAALMGTA